MTCPKDRRYNIPQRKLQIGDKICQKHTAPVPEHSYFQRIGFDCAMI